MPSFSPALETTLHRALELANERNHEHATLEHLLLALIDDRDAQAVMKACAVDLDQLRARVTEFIDTELGALEVEGASEATPTTSVQRVIHREFESIERTPDEIQHAKDGFVIRGPTNPMILVSKHHPDVSTLFPREDGELWVLTSRGSRSLDPGTMGVFDVFDAGGRFVRQVTLRGEGDPLH